MTNYLPGLDGQSVDFSVQPPREKFSTFAVGQITFTNSTRPASLEGRFAIVTNVEAGCGGRFARGTTNALEADGEVVWS